MRRRSFDSGGNLNHISNDKGRVETNPKLSNDIIRLISRLICHLPNKFLRTASGNSSQILDQLIFGHTDTIILDDYLSLGRNQLYVDMQVFVGLVMETLLLQGIRCIRQQLSQEDLAVSVQRFCHDVQQLLGLCLELHLLDCRLALREPVNEGILKRVHFNLSHTKLLTDSGDQPRESSRQHCLVSYNQIQLRQNKVNDQIHNFFQKQSSNIKITDSSMTTILGKYKSIRKLGKGAFGEVLLVEDAMGLRYALKMISLKSLMKEPYMMEYLQSELECMRTMHSPYIMRMVEYEQDAKYKYMLCEYCDGGDLMGYQANQKGQIFTLQRTIQILSHVINGLELLHREDYLHRDIKSTNILIKHQNGRELFKLADFGFSKRSVDVGGTVLGTENYMSPEIYHGSNYGFEVDMWSFGVLFFFMLNKEFPFKINPHITPERKYIQLLKLAKNFSYESAVKKTKKRLMENCTPEVEDIFKRMLAIDGSERITFFEIRKHALFAEYFQIIEESSKILYSKAFNVKRKSKNPLDLSMSKLGKDESKPGKLESAKNKIKEKFEQARQSIEGSLIRKPKKGQQQEKKELVWVCKKENANKLGTIKSIASIDDEEIQISHRVHQKQNDQFPKEIETLSSHIDRLQFLYESGIDFLNSSKLSPAERLNLSYNVTKYYIISMRNFIPKATSEQLAKSKPSLKWKEFCNTKQYTELLKDCSEDLSRAEMKFDFIYQQCEHILPDLNKINPHFSDDFDNEIHSLKMEGVFKLSYRKSTHYSFSRLREILIASVKKKTHEDLVLNYTMALLVICHLFNYIFDDIPNLNVIFGNYLVESKKTVHSIDYGQLREWMTRTSCKNLNKITTKIIEIYFTKKS